MRDLFGTRLELQARRPDGLRDRPQAGRGRCRPAGRAAAWSPGGLHFLTALPRIDGDPDAASLGDGVERLVARVADAWPGPPGPKLRLLPDRLASTDLLDRADRAGAGRAAAAARRRRDGPRPVGLDPDAEPHWLVFGDGRSGKSAALRAYVHEVVRTRSPEQAQLVVVDYRRSLLGEVPERPPARTT